MDTLPAELMSIVLDDHDLETNDYVALRAVSKLLHEVATPRAFKVLNVYPKENAHTRVLTLAEIPNVSKHVQTVVLCARKDLGKDLELHYYSSRLIVSCSLDRDWRLQEQRTDKIIEDTTSFLLSLAQFADNIRQQWTDKAIEDTSSVFSHLAKFTSLQNLQLDFQGEFQDSVYEDQPPSATRKLQIAVFEHMAQCPPLPFLHTFAIDNLMATTNDAMISPGLLQLLKDLKCIFIRVIADTESESAYCEETFMDFWYEQLPKLLRAPTANLRSLTVISDMHVPILSPAFWSEGFYPHLTRVHFHEAMFSAERPFEGAPTGDAKTNLEIFAINHKSTLRNIRLTNCSLERETDTDRTWVDVCRTLQDELVHLEAFTLDPLPGPAINDDSGDEVDEEPDDCYLGYAYLLNETGYIHNFDGAVAGPPPTGLDIRALDTLREVLQQRSSLSKA